MRRYEDGDGRLVASQQLENIEAVTFRHLHVEEHQIGPRGADLGDRLRTGTALTHRCNSWISSQQYRKASTCKWLVVHYQRTQPLRGAIGRHGSQLPGAFCPFTYRTPGAAGGW